MVVVEGGGGGGGWWASCGPNVHKSTTVVGSRCCTVAISGGSHSTNPEMSHNISVQPHAACLKGPGSLPQYIILNPAD